MHCQCHAGHAAEQDQEGSPDNIIYILSSSLYQWWEPTFGVLLYNLHSHFLDWKAMLAMGGVCWGGGYGWHMVWVGVGWWSKSVINSVRDVIWGLVYTTCTAVWTGSAKSPVWIQQQPLQEDPDYSTLGLFWSRKFPLNSLTAIEPCKIANIFLKCFATSVQLPFFSPFLSDTDNQFIYHGSIREGRIWCHNILCSQSSQWQVWCQWLTSDPKLHQSDWTIPVPDHTPTPPPLSLSGHR